MAARLTPEGYIAGKRDILTRCLRLTEELRGGLDDTEVLDGLLARRMDVILELKDLEDSVDGSLCAVCPQAELNSLNSMLQMIINLSKSAEDAMRESQSETLELLKSNTQKRKSVQYETSHYESISGSSGGRIMDKKE